MGGRLGEKGKGCARLSSYSHGSQLLLCFYKEDTGGKISPGDLLLAQSAVPLWSRCCCLLLPPSVVPCYCGSPLLLTEHKTEGGISPRPGTFIPRLWHLFCGLM